MSQPPLKAFYLKKVQSSLLCQIEKHVANRIAIRKNLNGKPPWIPLLVAKGMKSCSERQALVRINIGKFVVACCIKSIRHCSRTPRLVGVGGKMSIRLDVPIVHEVGGECGSIAWMDYPARVLRVQ